MTDSRRLEASDCQDGGPWNDRQPGALVIACSDGRFGDEVDDFLHRRLGVPCYDRLYVPGGAGALASSGSEFLRAQRYRSECRFLIDAHGIKRVILFFHGPAEDGPAEAVCGDYNRRLPTSTPSAVRRQQERDARQILRDGLGDNVILEIYFCEVTKDRLLRFEAMDV